MKLDYNWVLETIKNSAFPGSAALLIAIEIQKLQMEIAQLKEQNEELYWKDKVHNSIDA